jgi:hypothetical protein
MLANDGSSPGGRAALLRLSMDLKLHPTIVAAALEYAFDHQHAFPDASQSLCFGIVRQGYCANMQMLELALQRLQKDFGGSWNIMKGEGKKEDLTIERYLRRARCRTRLHGTVAHATLQSKPRAVATQHEGFLVV